MNLYGQIISPTMLRFNSSARFAIDISARNGIKKFGPYDVNLFAHNNIKCGIIYESSCSSLRDTFVNSFTKGEGSNFPGFTSLFRVHLSFDPTANKSVNGDERSFSQAVSDLATRNCDLVFIILSRRNPNIYRICKTALLSNGIPCQFVTADKIRNPSQRPWILGNIALASYAKIGGTPWVVADSAGNRELVMGVSRAQDSTKKFFVGFVTLFNQDGDFLLLHSKAPVIEWEEYVNGLKNLVIDAYQEYTGNFGTPESLIIHFHKRPGKQELDAVNLSLKHLECNIPYALIHLNEFSNFRLFDTAHSSFVPETGLKVNLSLHRALLLLDGRENDKRSRIGVPNVWDISMDKRSTMPTKEFPRLVNQIHRFARVNWRGFNAKSIPVTINYSKLICDNVLDIGVRAWNSLVSNGKLKDKAWFL